MSYTDKCDVQGDLSTCLGFRYLERLARRSYGIGLVQVTKTELVGLGYLRPDWRPLVALLFCTVVC